MKAILFGLLLALLACKSACQAAPPTHANPVPPPHDPTPPPALPLHGPIPGTTRIGHTVFDNPEQGCDPRDVSLGLGKQPERRIDFPCGSFVRTLLRNDGNCTLVTGGALTCDGNRRNCIRCTPLLEFGGGVVFSCPTLGIAGAQIVTATYLLGPLQGTIAFALHTTCDAPFSSPVAPEAAHTPVPCDPTSLKFTLTGPYSCGGPFTASLRTTSGCNLGSGGALVCDSQERNCVPCPATGSGAAVAYNCRALTTSGPQIVTSTYQLGNFIGTIAAAQDMNCPVPD